MADPIKVTSDAKKNMKRIDGMVEENFPGMVNQIEDRIKMKDRIEETKAQGAKEIKTLIDEIKDKRAELGNVNNQLDAASNQLDAASNQLSTSFEVASKQNDTVESNQKKIVLQEQKMAKNDKIVSNQLEVIEEQKKKITDNKNALADPPEHASKTSDNQKQKPDGKSETSPDSLIKQSDPPKGIVDKIMDIVKGITEIIIKSFSTNTKKAPGIGDPSQPLKKDPISGVKGDANELEVKAEKQSLPNSQVKNNFSESINIKGKGSHAQRIDDKRLTSDNLKAR